MSTTTPRETKPSKTVKVSTLVIAGAIVFTLVAGFIGGVITANTYNDNMDVLVREKTQALLELKTQE